MRRRCGPRRPCWAGTARSWSLERAGSGLQQIHDGDWRGVRAAAFHRLFDAEPTRWTTCGDCFYSARDALTSYISTLEWAQHRAARAIEMWAEAEQATQDAAALHEQEQAETTFVDPGEPLREEARAALAYAREQLQLAGDEAAEVVEQAQLPAPQRPSLLERVVDGVREVAGDAARFLGDQVGDATREAGELVDTVLDKTGDKVDRLLDKGGELVGDGLDRAADLTGFEALSAAGGTVREVTDEVGDRVDDLGDAAGGAVSRAADRAADRIEEAYDTAADYIEGGDDGDGDIGDGGDDGEIGDQDVGDDEEGGTEDGDDADPDEEQDGDEAEGEDHDDGQEPEARDQDVDRNGHWEDANDDKPDPAEISAEDARAHILYGDGDDEGGGHRHDSGVPDKTTFPPDWDDDKIIDEVEDVARNPDEPPVYDERRGTWRVRGTRDDVDIEVIVAPEGEVKTGYPTGGEGVHRNDENGEPQPLEGE